MIGISPQEADEKFLVVVQKIRPDLAPILLASIKTKILFETWFGRSYTSSLYFYPKDFQPSLIFNFAQKSKSAGDFRSSTNSDLVETKWKSTIDDLWQGYCYQVTPSLANFKVCQ